MDAFPFTEEEWKAVSEEVNVIVNATLVSDDVLAESAFLQLREVLGDLRMRYGDHPVLIETEADLTSDPRMQVELYNVALRVAEKNHLPTYTIRLSHAGVLVKDFGDARQATEQLDACEEELLLHGDQYERDCWTELQAECRQRLKQEDKP